MRDDGEEGGGLDGGSRRRGPPRGRRGREQMNVHIRARRRRAAAEALRVPHVGEEVPPLKGYGLAGLRDHELAPARRGGGDRDQIVFRAAIDAHFLCVARRARGEGADAVDETLDSEERGDSGGVVAARGASLGRGERCLHAPHLDELRVGVGEVRGWLLQRLLDVDEPPDAEGVEELLALRATEAVALEGVLEDGEDAAEVARPRTLRGLELAVPPLLLTRRECVRRGDARPRHVRHEDFVKHFGGVVLLARRLEAPEEVPGAGVDDTRARNVPDPHRGAVLPLRKVRRRGGVVLRPVAAVADDEAVDRIARRRVVRIALNDVHQGVAAAAVRPPAGEEDPLAHLQRSDPRCPRLERRTKGPRGAGVRRARDFAAHRRRGGEVSKAAAHDVDFGVAQQVQPRASRRRAVDRDRRQISIGGRRCGAATFWEHKFLDDPDELADRGAGVRPLQLCVANVRIAELTRVRSIAPRRNEASKSRHGCQRPPRSEKDRDRFFFSFQKKKDSFLKLKKRNHHSPS